MTGIVCAAIGSGFLARYITNINQNVKLTIDPATVKLTFDPKGGTVSPTTKYVTYGRKYGKLPTPVRPGYTFNGWTGENDLPGGYLRVEWIGSTVGGGQYIRTDTKANHLVDQKITMKCLPLALGGWMGSNGNLQIDMSNTSAFTTATWSEIVLDKKADKYGTITSNGKFAGTVNWNSSTYDNLFITFFALGNGTDGSVQGPSAARIYSASVESDGELKHDLIPCYYMVNEEYGFYDKVTNKFFGNNGKGKLEGAPFDPDILGYIDADTIVTRKEDHTVYASWIANRYTLTLNPNDTIGSTRAEGNTPDGKLTVTSGEKYTGLPNLTRVGYAFTGWFDKSGKQYRADDTVDIATDSELIARWDANEYTVSFDYQGGTPLQLSKKVTFDDVYGELPIPVREGYRFLGWSTSYAPTGYQDAEYIEC